jgi:hypothetical protein
MLVMVAGFAAMIMVAIKGVVLVMLVIVIERMRASLIVIMVVMVFAAPTSDGKP